MKPTVLRAKRGGFQGRGPKRRPRGSQSSILEGSGDVLGRIFEGFGEGFGELFKGLEASWFLVALWGFDLPSSVFCCFLAVLAAF